MQKDCKNILGAIESIPSVRLFASLRVMLPFSPPIRWIRLFSLAAYLLSGIAATLTHDHAGQSCCGSGHRAAASSAPTVSAESKRHCRHSFCHGTRRAPAKASLADRAPEHQSDHHNEGGTPTSISTRCAACDFLAQHAATPATSPTPAVSGYRWIEASPHATRCYAPVLSAFLARGPPAA